MNELSHDFSTQQIKTALEALRGHKEKPFVKHQWEELVTALCHCDDPALRERMQRKLAVIRECNQYCCLS